jgi:hypothetical protein
MSCAISTMRRVSPVNSVMSSIISRAPLLFVHPDGAVSISTSSQRHEYLDLKLAPMIAVRSELGNAGLELVAPIHLAGDGLVIGARDVT